MPGVEGIAGRGAHNGLSLARSKSSPQQANAPRVGFCRDENHSFAFRSCKGRGSDFDFVGRVHNGRFEYVNRLRRHSFVNQNESVVMILSGEGNTHLLQSFGGLCRMGQPDFRRVSFAVELGGLDGAHRHRSAEHNDRFGFPKRIFRHQPAAHAKENHESEQQAASTDGAQNRQGTRTPWSHRSGSVWSRHWRTGACYLAPPKRSNRRRAAANLRCELFTIIAVARRHSRAWTRGRGAIPQLLLLG